MGVVSTGFGWFVVALIGIAGSGFFADDKQGNVIEIYLSRLTREEYSFGKILGMVLYANIFTTLPILSLSVFYIQGFGMDHFQFLEVYLLVIIFGVLVSLILSSLILVLSTIIEKRAYASLSFVLFYFIASIFGQISARFGDEFLLLLSPSMFMRLLANSVFGLYEMDFSFYPNIGVLNLNDGIGLEYTSVLGIAGGLIVFLLLFLIYRIHRLTTDNI